MNAWPDTLPALLDRAWTELAAAPATRGSPWRQGALATVCPASGVAQRTVVLRGVDRAERVLLFHTDARSPKVAELALDPRAGWLAYDPAARVQLRLAGVASVHRDDALADEHWQATALMSRRGYLAPHAPGTPAAAASPNLPDHLRQRDPTLPESLPGRAVFTVLRFAVAELDFLELRASGHRRARFQWAAEGLRTSTWIEP